MVPYIKRKIIRQKGVSFEKIDDLIAAEKRLRVFINKREVISLHCTPLMIKELVTGLLLTEEILANKISPDQIRIVSAKEIRVEIHVDEEILKENLIVSRCLGGITFHKKSKFKKIKDDFSLSVETLNLIFEEFQQKSELFRLTGCFHSAALSDDKKIIAFAEDIGRHNAVDKVIGYSIFADIPFAGKLMVVSCRISSEIISKCARWGIPIIASRAAPTDLAIDIAEKSGITLAGFVRKGRLNVYTNTERIIAGESL